MFGDQTSSNIVTKHADVEVSGQMVETCMIKHRSNYGYKLLSEGGTHAHPNMFDTAVQTY